MKFIKLYEQFIANTEPNAVHLPSEIEDTKAEDEDKEEKEDEEENIEVDPAFLFKLDSLRK